jgi:ribonuclease P protein component
MRIRKRSQYQRISQQSTQHAGYWVIIDVRQNHQSCTKLGITVSRRYGIAVERNRFKRVVREAFRLCRAQLRIGFDINVKPRHAAHRARSSDIQSEFLRFLG